MLHTINRFLSETDGATEKIGLIPIIDKDKILWGRNQGPILGNRMESLTKRGLRNFRNQDKG